jgi:hypothetical protein
MEKQASTKAVSKASDPWVIKCIVVSLPSLLPDRFPLHPHVAFGFGLFVCLVVQHFIPPRGRHLGLLFALAAVLVVINVMFQ